MIHFIEKMQNKLFTFCRTQKWISKTFLGMKKKIDIAATPVLRLAGLFHPIVLSHRLFCMFGNVWIFLAKKLQKTFFSSTQFFGFLNTKHLSHSITPRTWMERNYGWNEIFFFTVILTLIFFIVEILSTNFCVLPSLR